MAPKLFSARYAAFLHECPHGDSGTYEVEILKGWFSRRELRTESKRILRACMPVSGATEHERVAAALEAAATLMRGLEARD